MASLTEEINSELGLTQAEFNAINTFYFMVFQPNPSKDRVKIWIDDGSLKVSMKRSKYIDLCVSLIGIKIQDNLSMALEEVGSFFILDRELGTIKHLQVGSEKEAFNVKKIFDENHKMDNRKSTFADQVILDNKLISVNREANKLNVDSGMSRKNKKFKLF